MAEMLMYYGRSMAMCKDQIQIWIPVLLYNVVWKGAIPCPNSFLLRGCVEHSTVTYIHTYIHIYIYISAANLQLSICIQDGSNFADFGIFLRTLSPHSLIYRTEG